MLVMGLILALADPQAKAAAPPDAQSEVVCRAERRTGTRFTKRICRKRADIEARADRDSEMMRELRGTGVCNIPSACGGGAPPR